MSGKGTPSIRYRLACCEKKTIHIIIFFLLIIIFIILITQKIGYKKIEEETEKEAEIKEEIGLDEYTDVKNKMIEYDLKGRDITDKKVLEVMEKVPRHKFVPENLIESAYDDNPLPIGYGQTISQPYIVALMTQSLDLKPNDKVLEIGTGSGYQAAILAEIVKEVYTIEIIKELAESASERLDNLGYENIKVRNADGYFGWEEYAPFDKMIITAAANHIPPPLLEQLKDGGKLIIPLGSTLRFQTLTLVTKKDNETETEFITGVRFVPMIGEALKKW